MKQIVFDEKTIEFLNGEKEKALDDIAVTIVHKDTLEQKDKEIERLNNIINELEKWLKEEVKTIGKNRRNNYVNGILNGYVNSFRKLQELKGDSSNE